MHTRCQILLHLHDHSCKLLLPLQSHQTELLHILPVLFLTPDIQSINRSEFIQPLESILILYLIISTTAILFTVHIIPHLV